MGYGDTSFNPDTFDQSDEERYDDIMMSVGAADGKSVEQIEKESRLEVPPGKHTFFVKDTKVTTFNDASNQPDEGCKQFFLGDVPVNVFSYGVEVTLALTSNPKASMKVFLTTPPSNPDEMQAYTEGTSKANGSEQGKGWHWRTIKQFLQHLGLSINKDGSLGDDCRTLKNWRRWPDGGRREVVAVVVPGQPDRDDPENTKGKKLYNQIKSFSYDDAESTVTRRRGLPVNAAGAGNGHAPAHPPTGRPMERQGFHPIPPAMATTAPAGAIHRAGPGHQRSVQDVVDDVDDI